MSLLIAFAPRFNGAIQAVGFLRLTYVSSMEQYPVVGFPLQLWCNVFGKRFLHLERCLSVAEPDAVCHPKHVGIDCNSGFAEGLPKHYVGGFSAHTRQACHLFHAIGYLAVKFIH